jgi:hypothetical protein
MVSSPNTDKVYIGSTVQALTRRFKFHRAVSNTTRSSIIIAAGDAKITELFKFKTCTVEELRAKELEYINQYKDKLVNLLGTKNSKSKDYKHPSVLDGRNKEWRKIKNDCCVCGGKYTNGDKAKHLKTKKHILGPEFENIKVNGKECSIA